MADGSFPSLVSKDRDVNAVGNPIFVQVSDGTESLLVNADGSINVLLGANSGVDIGDVDVTSVIPGVGATNLGKAVDDAGGATDTGVASLALRDDVLTTLTPVDGDYVRLRTTSTGALWVTTTAGASDPSNVVADDSAFVVGTGTVGVVGFLADETATDSVDEGDVGAPRMSLDRRVLTDSTLQIGDADVSASVPVPISATEAANSVTNPIFVYSTQDVVSSTEIHDYDTAAAVASDASDNHDYTVTGTTFLLKSVIVAGSGSVKFEIQTGPVAGLVTVAVGFLNDRQGDTKQIDFSPAVEVPVTSTGTVRVIRTNRQGAATDVYSTIIGNDV